MHKIQGVKNQSSISLFPLDVVWGSFWFEQFSQYLFLSLYLLIGNKFISFYLISTSLSAVFPQGSSFWTAFSYISSSLHPYIVVLFILSFLFFHYLFHFICNSSVYLLCISLLYVLYVCKWPVKDYCNWDFLFFKLYFYVISTPCHCKLLWNKSCLTENYYLYVYLCTPKNLFIFWFSIWLKIASFLWLY